MSLVSVLLLLWCNVTWPLVVAAVPIVAGSPELIVKPASEFVKVMLS